MNYLHVNMESFVTNNDVAAAGRWVHVDGRSGQRGYFDGRVVQQIGGMFVITAAQAVPNTMIFSEQNVPFNEEA